MITKNFSVSKLRKKAKGNQLRKISSVFFTMKPRHKCFYLLNLLNLFTKISVHTV